MSSQKKSNFLGSLQHTGLSIEEIEAFRKELN